MLTNFFNPDNAFWGTVNKIIDLVVLSLLWTVCSIPVITIGPASIALYYCVMKVVRKQRSYSVREFFRAFRSNFRKGIIIWLVVFILGLMMLGGDVPMLIGISRTESMDHIPWFILFGCKAAILAGAGTWCLLLQSRFDEKLGRLTETSFYLLIRYFYVTVLQLMILAAAAVLLFLEPLLLCIVPGVSALVLSFPTEPVLRRLCDRQKEESSDRDTWFLS